MKTTKIIFGALAAALLVACSPKKQETKTSEAQEVSAESVSAQTYPAVLDLSSIEWIGKKTGIDSKHNGTIALKSGEVGFDVEAMELKGGDFVIDMHSINVLDLEGDMKAKLEGHLNSADFFDVENYPEVHFQITSATKLDEEGTYNVVGNLTMKEATNSIEFKTTIVYDKSTNQLTADSEEVVIDRTKWGVNYNSKNIFKNLKDNIIDDQITIKLHIVAQL